MTDPTAPRSGSARAILARSSRLRRAASALVGVAAFGVLSASTLADGVHTASVRSDSVQFLTWPAGTVSVAAEVGDDVGLQDGEWPLDTADRYWAPQLLVRRTCIVPTPIEMTAGPVRDVQAGVHVAAAPAWHGCRTRLHWVVPPQTATTLVSADGDFSRPSEDADSRERFVSELAWLADSRAEFEDSRRRTLAELKDPKTSPDRKSALETQLKGIERDLADVTSGQELSTKGFAELKKLHAEAVPSGEW